MENINVEKQKFTNFKITKELWSCPMIGANTKLLMGYLFMPKKRILYASTHYIGKTVNLSKTTIANCLRELEENYYITLYQKPGTQHNLTIIHDKAFKEFKYDMKKISENWHFIKDEIDRNNAIKKASSSCKEMYMFDLIYKGGNKNV